MSGCPTPTKTEFPSEHQAKRALRSIKNPHGVMHPYRCGNHWHLGHNDRVDRHPNQPLQHRKRASR